MRLVDVIEQCSLCHTPDEVVWQITKTYTPEEIDRVIQIFLRGIGRQHQVPGKVIETLYGITQSFKEYENLTSEQQIYAVGRMIANWQEMSCESRANLLL